MRIVRFNKSRFSLTHTYSIVARDTKTGEMGVGVQSHYFSVGSVVSWGRSGIGVVATQALVNKSFGLKGLDLLEHGKSAQEALDALLLEDNGRDVRQVAILDAKGGVAVHTGTKCIQYAGHFKGKNFSVQANMMLSNEVWHKMAEAFEMNRDLSLPERILKSLEAAETVGGDIRGKQSAALLIVKGEPVENKWEDPMIDLRVEDHKEPLVELARLLKLWRAYEHLDKGDQKLEKGEIDDAFKEYNSARKMFPKDLEMTYWTAITLANTKKIGEALPLFKKVFKEDNNWRLLTERLPAAELLNVNKEDLDKILSL
jgi:uncharacterized Ntn-hydrolase superfamily protein